MIVKDERSRLPHLRRRSAMVALLLASLLMIAATAGCRQLYEGFKAQSLESCYQLSYPDRQRCLDDHDVSYDQYRKETRAGDTAL